MGTRAHSNIRRNWVNRREYIRVFNSLYSVTALFTRQLRCMYTDCTKLKNQPATMRIYVKSVMKHASKILAVHMYKFMFTQVFLMSDQISMGLDIYQNTTKSYNCHCEEMDAERYGAIISGFTNKTVVFLKDAFTSATASCWVCWWEKCVSHTSFSLCASLWI